MKNRLLVLTLILMGLAPVAILSASAQNTPPAKPPVAAPAAAAPAPEATTAPDGETAEHAFGLGLIGAATGRYQMAVDNFTKAITLKPDMQSAYGERGTAYYVLKQYPKAIADYTEALRLEPDDLSAMENRGLTYLKLKQYDNAIRDYDAVLAGNPGTLSARRGGNSEAIYGRGLARLGAGDLAGAYGDIELARKQNDGIDKYFGELGFAAPPAKPDPLPPHRQLPTRFAQAIQDTGKNPYLVRVTVIDDRNKSSRSACVTGPALLVALSRELGDKDTVRARQMALASKDFVFHFSKQTSLDPLRSTITAKDIADAREQMKYSDIASYEGELPGYRLTPAVIWAMACSFAEQGKPVRVGPPAPKVLP